MRRLEGSWCEHEKFQMVMILLQIDNNTSKCGGVNHAHIILQSPFAAFVARILERQTGLKPTFMAK